MAINIAHRGSSGKYPENTMLAFTKALEEGADGIEFDVHLSADGIPVIIHDEMLDRTTDATGPVRERSCAQLKELDASAGFKGVYGKNPIPTLEEYLEMIKGKKVVTNIEIKTGVVLYDGIEQKVLDMLDRFDRRQDVIISSFNHFTVQRMKQLDPDIKCAFLEESRIIGPAGYCAYHGVEYWHPYFYDMTPDVVAELKGRGIKINAWTVNTREDMLDMLHKGIDGVITNYPDLFYQVRSEFVKE